MKIKCADRMKKLRESRDLTQEELSVVLGIPAPTISRYEAGRSVPNASIVYKYCLYFKVSADYFLGLSEFKEPVDVYLKDSKKMMIKVRAFDFFRFQLERFENELNFTDTDIKEV